MRLTLIRHGQTYGNVTSTLDTIYPGADLTDLGRTQADSLVDRLAERRLDSIYVSNLVRTQQTAEPLAAAREVTPLVRDGLREIEAGDLEGRNDTEAIREYIGTLVAWIKGDTTARMGGGVAAPTVLSRFDDVVREIETSGTDDVAIVAHEAVITYWTVSRTLHFPFEVFPENRLVNTGIVSLDGSLDQGYRLDTWAGLDFTK